MPDSLSLTRSKPNVTFDIDGEEFTARKISIPLLKKHRETLTGLSEKDFSQDPEMFDEVFQVMLTAESWERFEPILNDLDNPLDMEAITDLISYLVGNKDKEVDDLDPKAETSSSSESQDGNSGITSSEETLL